MSEDYFQRRRRVCKERKEKHPHSCWETFNLAEAERLCAFAQLHSKCVPDNKPLVDVRFTGTGIGTAMEVECNYCEAKKDITDHSNW